MGSNPSGSEKGEFVHDGYDGGGGWDRTLLDLKEGKYVYDKIQK